ncbi:MAG: hypothetical protein R3B90_07790 [Planctomycetaceae bacterium]
MPLDLIRQLPAIKWLLVAVVALIGGSISVARAQGNAKVVVRTADGTVRVTTIAVGEEGEPTVIGDDDATNGEEAGDDEAAAQDQQPSPRLEKLQAATYDRRPSTILRVWSGLAEQLEAERKAEEEAAKQRAKAEQAEEKEEAARAEDAAASPDTPSAEATEPAAPDATAQPERIDQPSDSGTPAAQDEAAAQAAKAKAAADEEAAKAKAEARKQAEELNAIEAEIKALQRQVTLGEWGQVREYFATLKKSESRAGYQQMVTSLAATPEQPAAPGLAPGEVNRISLDDLIGIANASPVELDQEATQRLIPLLQMTIQQGTARDDIVARFRHEVAKPAEEQSLSQHQVIWLLAGVSLLEDLDEFLPTFEEALAEEDAEVLLLLAKSKGREYAQEGKPVLLEEAWERLLPIRGFDSAKLKFKAEALQMMLAMVPKLRDELGAAWLATSFETDPALGMEIIATTGSRNANALLSQMHQPAERLNDLKVQQAVVNALLSKAPEQAEQWRSTLQLLAAGWLREAEVSQMYDRSIGRGPMMQRDSWGNMFFMEQNLDEDYYYGGNDDAPRPIRSAELLKVVPDEKWLGFVSEELHPAFHRFQAKLYLKISEEEAAFPFIEQLAPSYPDDAVELVNEFIQTWTRNHDPNSNSRYTNSYMYMFGFDSRANGIPLTRSKQERNIEELAGWVKRIRAQARRPRRVRHRERLYVLPLLGRGLQARCDPGCVRRRRSA